MNKEPNALPEEMKTKDWVSNTKVRLEGDIIVLDSDDDEDMSSVLPIEEARADTSAPTGVSDETEALITTEPAQPAVEHATVSAVSTSGTSGGTVTERPAPSMETTNLIRMEHAYANAFENSYADHYLRVQQALNELERPTRRGWRQCEGCVLFEQLNCPACQEDFYLWQLGVEGAQLVACGWCRAAVPRRRRARHEDACPARAFACPDPACDALMLSRDTFIDHFMTRHRYMLRFGRRHGLLIRINRAQDDHWIIMAMEQFFYLKIEVDMRASIIFVSITFIGPDSELCDYVYEVSIEGQHMSRAVTYARNARNDLENASLTKIRDYYYMPFDQARNLMHGRNYRTDSVEFALKISKARSTNPAPQEPLWYEETSYFH